MTWLPSALVESLLVDGPMEGWKAAKSGNISGDVILVFWEPGRSQWQDPAAFRVRFSDLELCQWTAALPSYVVANRIRERILAGHATWNENRKGEP